MENNDAGSKKQRREEQDLQYRVLIGVILSSLLIVGNLGHFQIELPSMVSWLENSWVQLALTLPVQFWVGREFHRSAWRAFYHRTADMNTLI
jgi:P-type Cu+ transporter